MTNGIETDPLVALLLMALEPNAHSTGLEIAAVLEREHPGAMSLFLEATNYRVAKPEGKQRWMAFFAREADFYLYPTGAYLNHEGMALGDTPLQALRNLVEWQWERPWSGHYLSRTQYQDSVGHHSTEAKVWQALNDKIAKDLSDPESADITPDQVADWTRVWHDQPSAALRDILRDIAAYPST